MIYVDTSVLVAYYAPEVLSVDAENVLRSTPAPAISDLVELELFSALARKVRGGDLSAGEAAAIRARFLAHLERGLYWRIALDREHVAMARGWLTGGEPPLRSLDSLHLAIAAGAEKRLMTADRQLAHAASVLGVDAELVEVGSTWTIQEPRAEDDAG